MNKKNKSVWNEPTEKEPDVYKIIKDENLDSLLNEGLDEDDFDYELGYGDEY